MPEIDAPARRAPVPAAPAFTPAAATRVVPLLPAARVSLRIAGAEGMVLGLLAGCDLSGPINSCRVAGARITARLGPDEWLLIAEDGDGARLQAEMEAALAGRIVSLVDVGHRNAAVAVEGPDACAVLNGGIALDLCEAAFPAGSATRTLLGKAEVVLLRTGPEPRYRVECGRSFAPYVLAFLGEVAQEFA